MTTIEIPASDSSNNSEIPQISPEESKAYLESLSPEDREFMERMMAVYEKVQEPPSVEDTLRALLESGDERAFESELQGIVYELMDDDPYYQELFNQVTEARRNNSDYSAQTESINKLDNNYRTLVLSMSGLLEGTKTGEIELAKKTISNILTEKLGEDKSNFIEVQKALNIQVIDEQTGKYTYRFPTELMPESVNKEWETYLASVGDYNHATQELQKTGHIDQRDALKEVDARRKRIHDRLTKDFLQVIGLDKKDGWDFDSTRGLIATIRDREFDVYGIKPRNDIEAIKVEHQATRMDELVAENRDGLAVIAKLASKKKQS